MLLLFSLLVALPLGAEREALPEEIHAVRAWTTEAGLPSDVVFALDQDDAGYLWMATSTGVVRFDGQTFEIQNDLVGESGNISASALKAEKDVIWVGTADGKVLRIDTTVTEYRLSVPERIAELVVSGPVVWGRSRGGRLFRIKDNELEDISGDARVNDIEPDGDGGVWVASHGIQHLATDGTAQEVLLVDGVRQLHWSADEELLAYTTEDALVTIQVGRPPRTRPLPGEPDGALLRLRDGQYVVPVRSDQGTRLLRFDLADTNSAAAGVAQIWHTDAGVFHLMEDHEGNIWGSSPRRGLFRVRRSPVRITGDAPVFRIGATTAGSIVATRRCGSLDFYRDGHLVESLDALPGGPELRCVHALLGASDGALWVGENNRLSRTDGRETTVVLGPGNHTGAVSAIHEDAAGRIWVGLRGKLGVVLGDTIRFALDSSTLGEEPIRALYANRDTVWVGTNRGLHILVDGEVQEYKPSLLPNSPARSITKLPDGTLLIGWYGAGMTILGAHGVKHLRSEDGLLGDYVSGVLPTENGVWIHANRGAQRLDITALSSFASGESTQVAGVILDSADGFPEASGGGTASLVLAGDRLWFTSVSGLVSIPNRTTFAPTASPATRIRGVQVDGSPVAVDSTIRLGSNANELRVALTGVNLSHPERVRFHYIMEGFDTGWKESGHDEISYLGLPPGDYTLRVRAFLGGLAGDHQEQSVHVIKEAALYQEGWFQCLGALFFLGLAVGLRVAQSRQRNVEAGRVSRLVGQVFAAQEDESGDIARRIHDQLGGKLAVLKVLLKTEREPSKAIEMVQEVLDELRVLVQDMRPQSLDFFGLSAAIREMADTVSRASGITVDTFMGIPRDCRFRSDIEGAAYRFVRDSLASAVRHHHPGRIRIEVIHTGDQLAVTIVDTGNFATSLRAAGGFDTLDERARLLGGGVSVSEKAGRTRAQLVLPAGCLSPEELEPCEQPGGNCPG